MELTIDILIQEARNFSQMISTQNHTTLIGVTDGKAVGTYVEHLFQNYLSSKYTMTVGSSASGIDLPSVNTVLDITCLFLFTISKIQKLPVLCISPIVHLSRKTELRIIQSLLC